MAEKLIKVDNSDEHPLSKLIVLSGGIESRFIPALSAATKLQIEGSFKITGDKDLQKLTLSDSSEVNMGIEDLHLMYVLEGHDAVKLTLDVLH